MGSKNIRQLPASLPVHPEAGKARRTGSQLLDRRNSDVTESADARGGTLFGSRIESVSRSW